MEMTCGDPICFLFLTREFFPLRNFNGNGRQNCQCLRLNVEMATGLSRKFKKMHALSQARLVRLILINKLNVNPAIIFAMGPL